MTQPRPQRAYGGRSAVERRAERRARLLAAGLDLFGTVGYAMTPVSAVCKRANLSTRQYYEEFASREDLLIAVYEDLRQRALEATSSALADLGSTGFPARVRVALRTYLRITASDLRCARLCYVEVIGVSQAIENLRTEWRRRWAEQISALIRQAIESGETAARDYQLGVSAFIGATNGVLQDWCANPERAPLEDVVEELFLLAVALTTDRPA